VQNIAHRGASGYAPENTHLAFELAIEMGADKIETDVQLSADGELVLFHDAAVDRTSNGSGALADFTLAELRTLDTGAWFGEEFAGQQIVTLAELLETYLDRIPLVLEIKEPRAAVPMMGEIPQTERIEITSFDWDALRLARAQNEKFTFGFLTHVFEEETIERCKDEGFAQICPKVDTLTVELVNAAHEAGLIVRAWGVTRKEDIATLRHTGADGATCNWPDWFGED
jgi:glycerophosphoryl diester phosphodiesterase